MEVILLEKVQNLGKLGQKVKVKPGYARNYLFPGGRALPANEANLQAFEQRRAELERAEAEVLAVAQAKAAKLQGVEITITRRAGDEGRLFGSVGVGDIAEALEAHGTPVEKPSVRLAEGPLRRVGDHEVSIHLHPDVDATITVHVVAE